jgi:citrate lyase subunit beta/citryl-CoA lyase
MLFVPGSRLDWMLKAAKYGADALIFDLEDAVAISEKVASRQKVVEAIDAHAAGNGGVFVRLNGWRTGLLLGDLETVVRPGLTGVLLPKLEDVPDVHALDLVLGEVEMAAGLRPGSIEIIPVLETPLALYRVFDICRASARILRVTGVGGSDITGGDLTRALGVPANESAETEMMHLNARGILEARAAGVGEILNGATSALHDLDRVRAVLVRAKRMAATGTMVIHPSHVPIVNDVFSPTPVEIADARAVLDAMAAAVAAGEGSTTEGGRMVDYAHVRSAQDLIARAQSLGLEVGDVPVVMVHGGG